MKKVTLLAALFFSLIACSDTDKIKFANAGDYDSTIVSSVGQMQQTLFAVQKISGIDSVHAESDLKKYSAQIDAVTKSIKALPEYNGNTGYRDAAARLAEFYKKSVTGYYADIAKVYKEVKDSAAADTKVDEIITKLQEEETAADDEFIKEREAFASKNSIKLEEEEPK